MFVFLPDENEEICIGKFTELICSPSRSEYCTFADPTDVTQFGICLDGSFTEVQEQVHGATPEQVDTEEGVARIIAKWRQLRPDCSVQELIKAVTLALHVKDDSPIITNIRTFLADLNVGKVSHLIEEENWGEFKYYASHKYCVLICAFYLDKLL